MRTRLILVYLLSPWAAGVATLLIEGAFVLAGEDVWSAYLMRDTFGMVGGVYVVGLFLLPLYFVYERLGWRGWAVYVPTAVAGSVLIPLLYHIVVFSRTVAAGSGGIGAVSRGYPQGFGVMAAAAISGVVFSVVVRGPGSHVSSSRGSVSQARPRNFKAD